MNLNWTDGFRIVVRIEGDTVILSANREGLLSLANHLAALAAETPGSHIHLCEDNALEDGSSELIIDKTD